MDILWFIYKAIFFFLILFCLLQYPISAKAKDQIFNSLFGILSIRMPADSSIQKSHILPMLGKKLSAMDLKRKDFIPSGNLQISFLHGRNPASFYSPQMINQLQVSSSLTFKIAQFPFSFDMHYALPENIFSFRNSFQIRFDASAYQSFLGTKDLQKNQLADSIQAVLNTKIQKLERTKYYWMDLKNRLHCKSSDMRLKGKMDSMGIESKPSSSFEDSLRQDKQALDSLLCIDNKDLSGGLDTLDIHHTLDAIQDGIDAAKNQLKNIQQQTFVSKRKGSIPSGNDEYLKEKNTFHTVRSNFFENVKALELGLIHPMGSAFLLHDMLIRGVLCTYERRGMHYSACYGMLPKKMSTGLASEQSGDFVRNISEFLNWGTPAYTSRIWQFQAGPGLQEQNHLYLGISYVQGSSGFYGSGMPANGERKNWVVELIGKKKVFDIGILEWALGKSVTTDPQIHFLSDKNQFFDVHSRSMAWQGSFSSHIHYTQTKYSIRIRGAEPLFYSDGMLNPFPGICKYEYRIEQFLSAKLNYTFLFSHQLSQNIEKSHLKFRSQNCIQTLSWKPLKIMALRMSQQNMSSPIVHSNNHFSAISTSNSSLSIHLVPRMHTLNFQLGVQSGYTAIKQSDVRSSFFSYGINLSLAKGFWANTSMIYQFFTMQSTAIHANTNTRCSDKLDLKIHKRLLLSMESGALMQGESIPIQFIFACKSVFTFSNYGNIDLGIEKMPQMNTMNDSSFLPSKNGFYKIFSSIRLHW